MTVKTDAMINAQVSFFMLYSHFRDNAIVPCSEKCTAFHFLAAVSLLKRRPVSLMTKNPESIGHGQDGPDFQGVAQRRVSRVDEDEAVLAGGSEEGAQGATGCRFDKIRRWIDCAETLAERDDVHVDAGASKGQDQRYGNCA